MQYSHENTADYSPVHLIEESNLAQFVAKMGFSCCVGSKSEIFIDNANDFSYHFRRTHFGKKTNLYEFRCPLCNEKLINVNYIKTHFLIRHKEQVQFFNDKLPRGDEPVRDQPQIEDDYDSPMDFQLDGDSEVINQAQDEQQTGSPVNDQTEWGRPDSVIQFENEEQADSSSDDQFDECKFNDRCSIDDQS